MKRDLNMLMAAFQKLGLKFAAKDINDEKTMIMAALTQKGEALRVARVVSEEMKGDRELCMAAVAQNWRALEWASQEMKGDRELCMAAVAHDWRALELVSKEMKGDRELWAAAV